MDQAPGSKRSNIARPISRLPQARASSISPAIHQDDPKQSRLPQIATSNSKKPVVRPLGESNSATTKPSFGWASRFSSILSPTASASPKDDIGSLDTTPPSAKSEFAIIEEGNENAPLAPTDNVVDTNYPKKRQPRMSLSERTIETLSQISPAPSPTRRRSSTVKSSGSMGPPSRPASAMRSNRPTTPSTPSSGRPVSPSKRPFRPPGKPTTPAKDTMLLNESESIYTPPRALMRDASSRIGRPRDSRRSVSTAIDIKNLAKPSLKPTSQATKVKSLYDLRGAAARAPTRNPSLSTLPPSTPSTLERRPSYNDIAATTGLMKARSPGENVIASKIRTHKPQSKSTVVLKKPTKRAPLPQEFQQQDNPLSNTSKSSAALRDTIAKAKAAKREELRKSQTMSTDVATEQNHAAQPISPITEMGSQSLRKKIQQAVTSGSLNLSAMRLKQIPKEVLTMYEFDENSNANWSETVDLRKLLLADNELAALDEEAFPDWSEEEMLEDPEKSNQFGGLEVLDLHGNLLNAIPIGIRQLQQLQILDLSSNHLSISVFSIVSKLHNLRELKLAKNGLNGDLPAGSLDIASLQVLDLRNNQLDHLPSSLSKLSNLQRLLLGGNRFASFDLNTLPAEALIELDLSNNNLGSSFTAQGIERLQRLQSLNLAFNNIECLSHNFFELPQLQTLHVHNNRIDTLPDMSRCISLTAMTVADNALTSIPDGFYALKQLRNVDLSGNNIRSIAPEISSMESLSAFNIAGNPLREKKYLTINIGDIKDVLAQKATSEENFVSVNGRVYPQAPAIHGADIDAPMLFQPKNGILDLSSRSLSALTPNEVDLTSPIHTIRLANNDFTTLPVELLLHPSVRWSLKSLDLSHNPHLHPTDYLTSEIHLPLLQSLYIVSTGLTTLDTLTANLKAPELRELNISCHRLSGHIPWVQAWYPKITILLASDNWFESIDVEAVRGLEVLDIRNNGIEHLPPKIGLLGNHFGKVEAGRLRSFECLGNKFRAPRLVVIEKGTEAVLRDLRRRVPAEDVPEEWRDEV